MSRWRKAAPGVPVTPVNRAEALIPLFGVVLLLVVNHLGVVWGFGVHAEAMIGAGLFLPFGLVWVAYPGLLQAIERLSKRSKWSALWGVAAGLFLAAVGFTLGELLARWWYGVSLFL